jgi:hypothetical protein
MRLHLLFPANTIISIVAGMMLGGSHGRVAQQYLTTVSLIQHFLILGSMELHLINTS